MRFWFGRRDKTPAVLAPSSNVTIYEAYLLCPTCRAFTVVGDRCTRCGTKIIPNEPDLEVEG